MGTYKLIFDWMEKDICCSHVEVDFKAQSVDVIDYVTDWRRTFFGKAQRTIENLFSFLAMRCVDPNRPDIQDFLDFYGISEYDELSIVKVTHGLMLNDFNWLRFEGETMTYVQLRPDGRY